MSVFTDVFQTVFETRGAAGVIREIQQQQAAADKLAASFQHLNMMKASGTVAQVTSAQNTVNAIVKAQQNAAQIASVAGAGLAGGAALALLRKEVDLIYEAIEGYGKYATQIRTVQQLTGAGIGASSSFVDLSKVAGITDEQSIRQIGKIAQSLQQGNGKAGLAQLGISPKAGQDGLQIFDQVIGKLAKMQDGVRKTGIELQIFGEENVRTIQPLLNLQDDIIQKTALFSAHLDNKAIIAVQHLQQNVNLLGVAFMNDIVIPIAQHVVPVLDWMVSGAENVIDVFHKFDEGTYGLGSYIGILTAITAGFGLTVIAAGKFISVIKDLIAVEEVRNTVIAIGDALTGNWKNIAAAAVVGGVAYTGFNYLNKQNNIGNDSPADKIAGAADKISGAGDTMKAAADKFKSWAQAGGSEVPAGLTNADYSTFKRLDAWGAVG